MDTTSVILAYLSGIVDADGSIFITRRQDRHQRSINESFYAVICVSQTSTKAVELFPSIFGGKVVFVNQSRRTSFRAKQSMYRWTASTRRAGECIRQLRPYLRIKQQAADIALRLISTFSSESLESTKGHMGRSLKAEVQAIRRTCWEEMRNLHVAHGKGHAKAQRLKLM